MVGPGSRFSGTTHLQVNKPYLPGTLPQRQGWAPRRPRDPQPPGQVPPAEEVNIHVLPQRAQVGPVQKLQRSHRETQPRSISTRRAGKRFSEREVTGVDFGFFSPPKLPERPFEKPPWLHQHPIDFEDSAARSGWKGVWKVLGISGSLPFTATEGTTSLPAKGYY